MITIIEISKQTMSVSCSYVPTCINELDLDWRLYPPVSHSCWSVSWQDFSNDSGRQLLCEHHSSWLPSAAGLPGMFVARCCLWNNLLLCVEWDAKLYSLTHCQRLLLLPPSGPDDSLADDNRSKCTVNISLISFLRVTIIHTVNRPVTLLNEMWQ